MESAENTTDFVVKVIIQTLSEGGYRVPERDFLMEILRCEGSNSDGVHHADDHMEGVGKGMTGGQICVFCMTALEGPCCSKEKYGSEGRPYFSTEAKKIQAFCDLWSITPVGVLAEAIEGDFKQPLFCVRCEVRLMALLVLRENQSKVQHESDKLRTYCQQLVTRPIERNASSEKAEEKSSHQSIAWSIRGEMTKNFLSDEVKKMETDPIEPQPQPTTSLGKAPAMKAKKVAVAVRKSTRIKMAPYYMNFQNYEIGIQGSSHKRNGNYQVDLPSLGAPCTERNETYFAFNDVNKLANFNLFGAPFEVHDDGSVICVACFYARQPVKDFTFKQAELVQHILKCHSDSLENDVLQYGSSAMDTIRLDLKQLYHEIYGKSGKHRAVRRPCELCCKRINQCFLTSHVAWYHFDFRKRFSCHLCTKRFYLKSKLYEHDCPKTWK